MGTDGAAVTLIVPAQRMPRPASSAGPGQAFISQAILRRGSESAVTEAAIQAVAALCFDDLLTGDWDEALRLAAAGIQMCESHGFQELRWPLWVVTAVIAAARGDTEEAEILAGKLADWGSRRGSATVRLYARYVQCLVAQVQDDFEYAYRCVSELAVPGTFAANLPLALAASMDFVECAVRTDRIEAARAFVAMLPSVDDAELSPRVRLLTGCAAALVDPRGNSLFDRLLTTPDIEDLPYDRARVQLAYAERLRRTGSLKNARTHLAGARTTFAHLGARPWHCRTLRELRGTGQLRTGADSLTSQERAIAELAASGLTNKQIATPIYLSHRTVGFHLQRVFQKLQIPNRAALRDALANLPAAGH